MTRTITLRTVVGVAALTALLTSGAAFAASGSFSDVADDHPFADEIAAIAEAGIMSGAADGTFSPDDDVTRGSMAAFLSRGLGRAAADSGTASDTGDRVEQPVAEVQIRAGADGSQAGGYVVVTGNVNGSFLAADCPCHVRSELLDVTDNTERAANIQSMGNTPTLVTAGFVSVTSTWVFPIAGGQTKIFRLNGSSYVEGASTGQLSGQITAVYVPFDGLGNSPEAPDTDSSTPSAAD
jgi:hypothetical protein